MARIKSTPLHNYKNNSYLISFESFPFKKIALGVILLLSLLGSISPAVATPDEVKWSRFDIPLDGKPGNWVLADGSDVQHLTMASDGTLYAYGKGLTYTLYESADGGYSWSAMGKVTDAIVDIAIAPDGVVYYATSSAIYKPTHDESGDIKFISLPSPGGAGSNGVEITSFDITRLNNNVIVAGTRDTDIGEYGGVYVLDEIAPFTWTDTNIGNYDVYAVAFSPNFPGDRQLVAVVTDETDTFVTTKFGSAGWGATTGDARLDKDNSGVPTPVAVANSATIAFPDGYDSEIVASYFVAIDAGGDNGDVYKIVNSVATDLNIGSGYNLSNVDVTGLAITGNAARANLLAGAATSTEVYFSPDGGRNWTRSTKPPTGQGNTYVAMAPDFADSGRVYAATTGTESAFSISQDSGVNWNQAGLIDTDIIDILDLAPSPSYSEDNTLFMLTWGGEHSLWRSLNGGAGWERILSSTLASVDEIDRVELPPQYSHTNQIVFIAGTGNGNPVIWKSTDNGQTFASPQVAPLLIETWAVVNDTTLFIGCQDAVNNHGLVYRTTDSGLTYSKGAIAGSHSLNSIVLSPNYDEDETILVGNTNGWVYWSNDNGTSFEPLPPDASTPPLTDLVIVAFDPGYSRNNTVYAASNTADEGIYRFNIGTRTSWEKIDSPTGGMVSQLILSPDGTLYATNSKADGGMERCLNPTYPLGPTFETVTRGLDDGAQLTKLWLADNTLWAADAATSWLMTYTDSLTLPVTLTSPPDKASGMGTIINYTISNVSLDWETLRGATEYQWQLDYDTDFSTVPTGFEGNPRASTTRLPVLEPDTTYYWRVRASEPVLSPWSAKWSFTTSFGTEAIAPELVSPEAGARGMPIKPVFQWSAVAGADSYELLVSADASLANPSILKTGAYALPTTAWQCNTPLNYDTTYYWKVRAISGDSYSAWSAVGAFTTELQPQPESPPPPSPLPPPQPTTPDWMPWLMPLGGIFLLAFFLVMMMMLITMIILTIKVLKL